MYGKRFEECYLKYRELMLRAALDKTGDYQSAEDLCQDVFFSFYLNISTVGPEYEKAWLLRCLLNRSIDRARKLEHRQETLIDIRESEYLIPTGEGDVGPEQRWDDFALIRKIFRELQAVNAHWFEALRLYCIEELSYEEAAAALGITVSVLRARIHRARSFVREQYEEEYRSRL